MAISRREFLHLGGATALGLGLAPVVQAAPKAERLLFITLLGGPSQLDTWDPKPDAPSEIRGPFASIPTAVPGVRFSELFPKMAANFRDFCVVRSMHHTAAPIHETGLQLTQTGRLADSESPIPSFAARLDPVTAILPRPIGFTGVPMDRGQAFWHDRPQIPVSVSQSERYGRSPFGDDCQRGVHLLEQGVKSVTVNMFTDVYDTASWDCHAAGGLLRTTLDDYRWIGPVFDAAYTALLTDLKARGLFDSTLVVATGEFGRTPKLNRDGGRDHWAGAWSMLLAGAGVEGGTVIGSTDRHATEVRDTPMTPADLATRIETTLGLTPLVK
jgi:Protein of unknown function (DUF1501)